MLKLQFGYQTQEWDEMFHPAANKHSLLGIPMEDR